MHHEDLSKHEYDLRSYYGDPADNPDEVREAAQQDMMFNGRPDRAAIVDNTFAAVEAATHREDQAEGFEVTLLSSTDGLLSTRQPEGAAVDAVFRAAGADIEVSGEDANGVWEQYRSGTFNGKPVHFVERFIPVSETDHSTASMQVLMVGKDQVDAAVAKHRYGGLAEAAVEQPAGAVQGAGELATSAVAEKPARQVEDMSAQEVADLVKGEHLAVEDVQLFSKAVQTKLAKIARSETLSIEDRNFVASTTALYVDNMIVMFKRGAALPGKLQPGVGVNRDGLVADARYVGVSREHAQQFGEDRDRTRQVLEAMKAKHFMPPEAQTPERYARYATDLAQSAAGYFDAVFAANMQGRNADGLTHDVVVYNLQEMAGKYKTHERSGGAR